MIQKDPSFLSILLLSTLLWSCQESTIVKDKATISESSIDSTSRIIKDHKQDTISIKYGKSFGQCIGYCFTEYNIHSWGIEKNSRTMGDDTTRYPAKQQILPIDEKNYTELVGLLDFSEFQKLENVIGCPDCNDGGAEWIEIQIGEKHKEATFEFGSDILPIKAFLKKIRALINTNTKACKELSK